MQSLPEPSTVVVPPTHIAVAPMAAYAALGLARIELERGSADTARYSSSRL